MQIIFALTYIVEMTRLEDYRDMMFVIRQDLKYIFAAKSHATRKNATLKAALPL